LILNQKYLLVSSRKLLAITRRIYASIAGLLQLNSTQLALKEAAGDRFIIQSLIKMYLIRLLVVVRLLICIDFLNSFRWHLSKVLFLLECLVSCCVILFLMLFQANINAFILEPIGMYKFPHASPFYGGIGSFGVFLKKLSLLFLVVDF